MLRQFLSGSKAILKNKAIVNGQILFPNDASEIYYDINNVRRTVYGLFYVDNDVDLVGIANPEEKLYFSHGSKRVFAYNASTQEFVQVNRTGVVNNLTSAQRNALTSCVEDSIYIDSDTLEMYIGTNMGSNSLSASMFGNVYWHKIGESISNYNGLVSIRTNDKNVLSTNIGGDVTIGDSSNSCSINTSNLRLNNNAQNTANGVVVLDNNGKILQSLIPQGSGTATSSPIMETINVTTIPPEHNKVYHATLSNNDVFTFTSPQNNNEVLSFRLYLTMPQTLVSFTLPTNVVWELVPDFTTVNSLYTLVFEWNPVIKKWLGNQMWNPISLDDNSNSSSGAGGDDDQEVIPVQRFVMSHDSITMKEGEEIEITLTPEPENTTDKIEYSWYTDDDNADYIEIISRSGNKCVVKAINATQEGKHVYCGPLVNDVSTEEYEFTFIVEAVSLPVPTVPVDDSLLIVTNGQYESTFDQSVKTLDGEYILIEGAGVDRIWECGDYTLKHYEASGTSCWAFFEGENTMPIAQSKTDSENPWDIEYMNQGGILSGKLSVSIVEVQASTINAEEAVSGSYYLDEQ